MKKLINLIPFIILVLLIVPFFIFNSSIVTFIYMAYCWISIPLFVGSVVWALIASIRCFVAKTADNSRFRKAIVLSWLTVITAYLLTCLYLVKTRTDIDTMESNYLKNGSEIETLVSSLSEKMRPGCNILISFEHNRLSDIEVWCPDDERELKVTRKAIEKKDSLLRVVGLDGNDLQKIGESLRKARCNSIRTRFPDYCSLKFGDALFSSYHYEVYLNKMTDKQMENALSSNFLIPFNDHVVFCCLPTMGPDDAGFNPEVKEKYLKKYRSHK